MYVFKRRRIALVVSLCLAAVYFFWPRLIRGIGIGAVELVGDGTRLERPDELEKMPRDKMIEYVRVLEAALQMQKSKNALNETALRDQRAALEQQGVKTLTPAPAFYRHILSRVILTASPSNFSETVVIDAGSRAGVEVGDPVVWKNAIVGRVSEVRANASKVLLISDPDFKILAYIPVGDKQPRGILHGSPDEDLTLVLDYIGTDTDIDSGQKVLSTGREGKFPPDFELGETVQIDKSAGGLYYYVKITPAIDLRTVTSVLVLKMKPLPKFREDARE